MGQKVNAHGMRVGIIKDWDSKWFADKDYADKLHEDFKIRTFVKNKLYKAGISKIEIQRTGNTVKLFINTAKPGMVIGKNGEDLEAVRSQVQKMTEDKVILNVVEVKNPEKDAQLVAENIAFQLENRVAFRRAMKQSNGRAMKAGVKGIKSACSGRLGGAEMARTEAYVEGTVPLQTLRADINYGFAEANTSYGKIGVKVWVYNGEVLPTKKGRGSEK
ncbi:MAG: 30S ribosomal protein S3 [Clostridia bacterium]|jgi:small subunit ribosomal protein S3|nr:30S ribosomal protein S3 [Clostridia bacterium]